MHKISPDIEDTGDVGRYCIRSFYPLARDGEGNVTKTLLVAGCGDGEVSGEMYDHISGHAALMNMTFDEFLALEQGFYKSRLVEYADSIVYLRNQDAVNRDHRIHGLRADVISRHHHHPDVTQTLESMSLHRFASVAWSTKRTPFSQAQRKLSSGDGVGYAMSDNFGVITTSNSEYSQLVWKKHIIGDVVDGAPRLKAKYSHLYRVMEKLCAK